MHRGISIPIQDETKLVERYNEKLFNMGKRYGVSDEDVKEITQDSLVHLLKLARRWNQERETIKVDVPGRFISSRLITKTKLFYKYLLRSINRNNEILIYNDMMKKADSLDFEIQKKYIKKEVDKILREYLRERDYKILILRYGLDGGYPRTLEEVGQIYGICNVRVRQIEARAIRRLRHPTIAKKLEQI